MIPGKAGLVCRILLVLAVARLWFMPLPSSFWVDEMGTVFVVQRGAHDPSLAVAPQVAQSIYYWLPRVSQTLFGLSEIAYRLPSLAAMGIALFLVARLAARLIHPEAAWFAAFGCLALRGFNYQAADTRPYGLGTLVACAAVWWVVHWLDHGRWRDAALFVVFAALLWRVHLAFWPFYLVFVIYAAARIATIGWPRILAVFGVLGLALLPVLVRAMRLYGEASAHVVVAPPGLRDLFDSLKLGIVVVCGAGAWALARALGWQTTKSDRLPRIRPAVLFASWWLCQPVGLFAFSHLTGASIFVPRYLWLGLPGAVLTGTLIASRFIPANRWLDFAAVLGAGVLVWNGQWTRLYPLHHNSDWRSAAAAVTGFTQATGAPVICPSPFVEAKPPAWSPDYRLPGFLYAHLYVYPIPGKPILFPFESSPEAEAYAMRLLHDGLTDMGRFVIYGGAGQASFWRAWFERQPELSGWRSRKLGDFADVQVIVFQEQ